VVSGQGYAGHLGLHLDGGGLGELRVNISRRDRNFRQLAEQPTFLTRDAVDVSSTIRLDRLAGSPSGWMLPLTITHSTSLSDPYFLTRSDIPGSYPAVRTPRDTRRTYTLVARRSDPADSSAWSAFLSRLTLRGTYSTSDVQSEYGNGDGGRYAFGADFDLGPAASTGASRWRPTILRISSGLSRASDSRVAFLTPSETDGGASADVRSLQHAWNSSGSVEFRPLQSLSARIDVSSDRDLRDYDGDPRTGAAVKAASGRLLGADIGMERARGISSALAFFPRPASWLAARFSLSTRYNMLRDAAAPLLAPEPANPLLEVIPLRLVSSQQLSSGFTVDFGQLVRSAGGDSLGAASVARVLAPLDVNYSRNIMSTFRNAESSPSMLYQLALGDAATFRSQNGDRAAIAGETQTIAAGHAIRPFRGATITNRAALARTRSWTALFGDDEYFLGGQTRTFPDVGLRLEKVRDDSAVFLRSATAQASFRRSVRTFSASGVEAAPGAPGADRSSDRSTTIPVSLNLVWAALGGVTTSGDYTLTLRDEVRPGARIDGKGSAANANISWVIPAGAIAGLTEDVRARLYYRGSSARSVVVAGANAARSRLVDNGVYSFGVTADSDLSDTMVLSFGASRTVTYDRNVNRRVTQTTLSAVLQIDFAAR
jgi:hypothetical protein